MFSLAQVLEICRGTSSIQYLYHFMVCLDVFSTSNVVCHERSDSIEYVEVVHGSG